MKQDMLINTERLVTAAVPRIFFLDLDCSEHYKIISFKWKSSKSTSKVVPPSK